jgi:large-conductance mechanosensitive channel
MRWLQLILSFLMKRVTTGGEKPHPMEEFKEFMKENALKLFVGMVLLVTIGTMLTAGLYMLVASLAAQSDLGLPVRMTAMAWGGFLLALVPALILSFAWYKSSPHEVKHSKKKKNIPEQPATLEQALALLVTDFVEERHMKREIKFERERRIFEAELNAGPQNREATHPSEHH